MKTAVSAASGRLGHAVLRELLANTASGNIVAIARTPEKVLVTGIEKRSGDYNSVESMIAALAGIDTLVMISAPVGNWDRVLMHRNVIAAARRAGVRKIVFTSVIGNGQEQDTWFWGTQQVNRQTEEDLKSSGLEWVIARNGLYLEMDLRHIIHANASGVYRNVGGEGECGYITIDELAFAIARLAQSDRHNGKTFNLVGQDMSQAALVQLANEVLGLKVRYETLTDEENIALLMRDEKIAVRGKDVARMLTGCFQCVRNGAFKVQTDFEAAAGRPVKSTRRMMEELRAGLGDSLKPG
ncbi:MAG: NAD(P)H-binding protein [Gammaproteobacteria bacterium]|mgnify:CR=1 FL=1|nr:NAD(P)H-binding protein [Gammaproteobacteria bacterium]MCP5139744.1 NAD(P)H-binding protein [Chromatiales bacterium]